MDTRLYLTVLFVLALITGNVRAQDDRPAMSKKMYKRVMQLKDKRQFLDQAFKRLEKFNHKSKPVYRKPPLRDGEKEDIKFRFPVDGLEGCRPICSSNLAIAYCRDGRFFATKKSGSPESMRANAIEFQFGKLSEINDQNQVEEKISSENMKANNLELPFVVNDNTLHQNHSVKYIAAALQIPTLECVLVIEFYLFQRPALLEYGTEFTHVTPNDIKVKLSIKNWPESTGNNLREQLILKIRPPESTPSGSLPEKIADSFDELTSLKNQQKSVFDRLETQMFERFLEETQPEKMEARIAEMATNNNLARELEEMRRQVERTDILGSNPFAFIPPFERLKDVLGASIWDLIEDDGEVQNDSNWESVQKQHNVPANGTQPNYEDFDFSLLGSFARDIETFARMMPGETHESMPETTPGGMPGGMPGGIPGGMPGFGFFGRKKRQAVDISEQKNNFSEALWDIESPNRYVLNESDHGGFSLPKKVMVDGQLLGVLQGDRQSFIDQDGYINVVIDLPRMVHNMSYEFYLHTPMATEQVARRKWKPENFLKELIQEKTRQRLMYKKLKAERLHLNITKPPRPKDGFKIVERDDCKAQESEEVVVQYCDNRGTLFIGKKSANMEAGAIRLQLASIEEVGSDGNSVDKMDEAELDNQAKFKFSIDDAYNYKGNNVTHIAGDALLASGARIKLEFSIFKQGGAIENGEELNFVNPDSVKMNLEVHNWTFTNLQNNQLAVTFEVLPPPAARRSRTAEKLASLAEELDEFSPDAPDMKTPARFALGGGDEGTGVLSFSKMVLNDNVTKEMTSEYPKVWSDDEGRRFFQIAFPSFSESAIYDPTVEDPPLSAEEQIVLPSNTTESAPTITSSVPEQEPTTEQEPAPEGEETTPEGEKTNPEGEKTNPEEEITPTGVTDSTTRIIYNPSCILLLTIFAVVIMEEEEP